MAEMISKQHLLEQIDTTGKGCEYREQRERGPVFPLCIVPPLVFVAHD